MTWYIISYELQRKGYSLNMINLLSSLVNLDLLKIEKSGFTLMPSIVFPTNLATPYQDVETRSHTPIGYSH